MPGLSLRSRDGRACCPGCCRSWDAVRPSVGRVRLLAPAVAGAGLARGPGGGAVCRLRDGSFGDVLVAEDDVLVLLEPVFLLVAAAVQELHGGVGHGHDLAAGVVLVEQDLHGDGQGFEGFDGAGDEADGLAGLDVHVVHHVILSFSSWCCFSQSWPPYLPGRTAHGAGRPGPPSGGMARELCAPGREAGGAGLG